MKSQKGFIIPLIIAIIAILVVGGVVFVMQKKEVKAPVIADISNWKTYTNIQYGFEFKYPNNSYVVTDNSQVKVGINADIPTVWVYNQDNNLYNNQGILKDVGYYTFSIFLSASSENFDEEKVNDILTHGRGYSQEVLIDNHRALKYFDPNYGNAYWVEKKVGSGLYYIIQINRADIGEQILSTFKFIATTTNPIINNITPNAGPKGTIVQISGKNLSGFEGDLNVTFERADGRKILLKDTFGDYVKTGGSLIKVKVIESCQKGEKVIGEYSGIESVCDYVELTPGLYKVYTEPWGVKSNVVNFTIIK